MYPAAMTAPAKDDDRTERLAAALRENLKRRKAQARVREDAAKIEIQPAKSPSR